MSQPGSSWTSEALAVFVKDWRCEYRTRYALNTLGLFAFTTLVVVSVVLGPVGNAPGMATAVLPVILWLIVLFAVTAGLPRVFVAEEETHTATALRLAATPSALFCGKLAYGFTVVLLLEALITPLFLAMVQLGVERPGLLVAALVGGGFGMAAGSTLIAAMVAQARTRSALFAVLLLPVLVPGLLFAVQLTRAAIGGEAPGVELRMLVLYDGTLTVAGLMLFPPIWNP
ncbi:MAG: heme exporter protein CcmB [Acidobacteriota bacterium]|jgi:heme exporter protein B